VIVLGVLLLVVGWLLNIGIIETLGIVVLIIGVLLLILGAAGHAVGGRSWY